MSSTAEPRLPSDLERTIFELAADRDPPTAVRIILVAHRCRDWIEPILYRFVVVCQSSWSFPFLLRTLESRPAHYARWIKEIRIDPYILPNDPAVARILSICTAVEHLVDFSYGRTPFSILAKLRLKKMCTSLDIIDGLPGVESSYSYLRHQAFAQLTHLHILDPSQRWSHVPFSALPALTHLALQNYKPQIRAANVPVLQKILAECVRLEFLVVLIPLCRSEDQNMTETKLLVNDPRFVVLLRSSNCRHDIWAFPLEEKYGSERLMALETCEQHTEIIASDARERQTDNIWATKTTRRRRRKRTGRRGV